MGEIIDIRDLKRTSEAEKMTKLEFEARVIYLKGYIDAVNKKRSAEMELEERELDCGPSARSLSGMPSGGKKGDGADHIINNMESKDRLREIIRHSEEEAIRLRVEIENVIENVYNGDYRTILRYRYINDMYLEDIAEVVNYSVRQVQRHHQRGVERLRPPRHEINRIKRELMQEHPEWASLEIKSA